MSKVHVLAADGSHTPYDESTVREMLQKGLISPQTLYWREGIPEWRPVFEMTAISSASLPVGMPPQPLPSISGTGRYQLTKKLEPLSTIVMVMTGLSVVPALLIIASSVLILFHTMQQDFISVREDAHWMQIFAYVSIATALLRYVPFLMWIYRANANCHGMATGLKYSSGMAAGCFFIPFANLVYPCMVMQEIWKVSANPPHWQTERNSILVGFWWAFYLICVIVGVVVMYFPKAVKGTVSPAVMLNSIGWTMISLEMAKIILYAITITMVYMIAKRQKQLVAQAGS